MDPLLGPPTPTSSLVKLGLWADIKQNLGTLRLSRHISPPFSLSFSLFIFFFSKDNFSEYFMGYIASISLRLVGRLARNDGGQGHPAAHEETSFLFNLPPTLLHPLLFCRRQRLLWQRGWLLVYTHTHTHTAKFKLHNSIITHFLRSEELDSAFLLLLFFFISESNSQGKLHYCD